MHGKDQKIINGIPGCHIKQLCFIDCTLFSFIVLLIYSSLFYFCILSGIIETYIFDIHLAFLSTPSLMKAGNKPPPATPGKPKKATTFQEFESITSDAWDVGDDDDELLAMAAQNLNIEVVMETANKVRII